MDGKEKPGHIKLWQKRYGEEVNKVNMNSFLEKIDGKEKLRSTHVIKRLCKIGKKGRLLANYFVSRKGLVIYFVVLDSMLLLQHLSSLPSKTQSYIIKG